MRIISLFESMYFIPIDNIFVALCYNISSKVKSESDSNYESLAEALGYRCSTVLALASRPAFNKVVKSVPPVPLTGPSLDFTPLDADMV